MRTLWIGLSLVAWSFTACGSESTTTLDTDVSSEPATSSPSSAQPSLADNTSVPDEPRRGVPLDQVLQPYEAAAVEASDGFWQSYTLQCRTPPVLRGGDWPPPADREELIGRGAVIECVPRTDPPADTSGVWLIVLDDAGTSTSWYEATDGTGVPPLAFDRTPGLLCREYIDLPVFAESMANLGEPPWSDDKIAYQFVLAYWFLEGQPSRMDVDGNGIPCELVFDPAIVAEVWAGDS
jgi:hypothetical protein